MSTSSNNTEITESPDEPESKDNWQVASSRNQKTLKNRGTKKKPDPPLTEPLPSPVNDSYNTQNVELVRRYVSEGDKCLIILRGCPGSGKTTLAK